jgi:hypothetical protein
MKPLPVDIYANKTEAAYGNLLELRKMAGEIVDYKYEPLKFRLADRTYYTPDFLVVHTTHFEIHETKGFWKDDARVKIKVAAEQFPWFIFWAVTNPSRKLETTGWEWELISRHVQVPKISPQTS